MKKRSQVTLFVALGILILIVAGIFFYSLSRKNAEQLNSQQMDNNVIAPLKSYVEQCLHQTAKQAILKMGQEGRIYSDVNLVSEQNKIAFFYYKGAGFFPTSINTMEEDMSRYIKENLGACTDDYSFLEYDVSDDFEKLRVSSNFYAEEMAVDIFFPVTVTVGDTEITLDDFSTSVDFRYPGIYDASKEIYKRTKSDPEWVDIDYLSSLPYKVRLIKVSSAPSPPEGALRA